MTEKKKINIATLGPKGTFSHQATDKVKTYLERRNAEIEIVFRPTITQVFRCVKNGSDLAVVPLENSEADMPKFFILRTI